MTSAEQQAIRSWALAHLGLNPAVTSGEVQAAFLDKIRRDGFVPPSATVFAFRFLSGDSQAAESDLGRQQAHADVEVELRREVDAFAGRFFEAPPDERQKHWRDLWRRCSWIKPLRTHLDLLKPALALVPTDLVGTEGPRARLADMLCQLFVLRPPDRARLRLSLREELAGEIDFWDSAARDLREHFPQLVGLDPAFIVVLADRERHAAKAWQVRKQIAAAQRQQVTSSGANTQWAYWPVFVVIMLVSGMARSCSSTSTIHNPPTWRHSTDNVDPDLLRDLTKPPWKVDKNKPSVFQLD